MNDKGHLFLPEVARGTEERFAPVCNRIASNIYEFNRTINLPGRRELEVLINEKVQGLDGEIRQRLNKKVLYLCLLNISKTSLLSNQYEDENSRAYDLYKLNVILEFLKFSKIVLENDIIINFDFTN